MFVLFVMERYKISFIIACHDAYKVSMNIMFICKQVFDVKIYGFK